MNKSYSYQFKVDPHTFRKALYFNTFAKQRFQSLLVGTMWTLGICLAVANLVFKVEMSNVMQMCYIVLLVTMPLLMFSCERSYRQYRSTSARDKLRVIGLSDDWVKLQVVGGADSEKLEWRMVAATYELEDMFIIYRDLNLMVILPKDAVPADEQVKLRELFSRQLGKAFHARMK